MNTWAEITRQWRVSLRRYSNSLDDLTSVLTASATPSPELLAAHHEAAAALAAAQKAVDRAVDRTAGS